MIRAFRPAIPMSIPALPPGRFRPLAVALGGGMLLTLSLDAMAAPKLFTSHYRDALVFRDRNGDSHFDGGEPSTGTSASGTFTPPRGRGRLYLQGGFNVATGEPNTLLLTAPRAARAIGTLTSLWQALLDRNQTDLKIKKLLGLKAAAVAKVSAAPLEQGSPKAQNLARKDAQHDTLAQFVGGLALGSAAAPMRAAGADAAQAQGGDPVINALADALLAMKRKNLDMADPGTVRGVLNGALDRLKVSLAPERREVLVQVVSAINQRIGAAGSQAQLDRLAVIRENATALVQRGDFDTLAREFTGDALDLQVQGQIFILVPVITGFADDTGSSATDGITTDTTPTLSGTEAGSAGQVRLYRDGVAVATAPVDGQGRWTYTSPVLARGRYVFTATGVSGEQESQPSPGLTVTVQQDFLLSSVSSVASLAALGLDGNPPNDSSTNPSMSADGLYVAFLSRAGNLTTEGQNGNTQIYLSDLQDGGSTRLISEALDGGLGNQISYSAFVSGDGGRVVFLSDATNLVSNSDGNGETDVFLRDVPGNATTLISVATDGGTGDSSVDYAAISADGWYVAFDSDSSNLVANDTNGGGWDIFLRNLHDNTTTLVSLDDSGNQTLNTTNNVDVSQDGRYVVFEADGDGTANGWEIFRRDTRSVPPATQRISVTNGNPGNRGGSNNPTVSADGRYVAFESDADNLDSGGFEDTNVETDIFLRDIQQGSTRLISRALDGSPANGASQNAQISEDGRYVIFASYATNLVADTQGDNVRYSNVYLYDVAAQTIALLSKGLDGQAGNGPSDNPSISGDGRAAAFDSYASSLMPAGSPSNSYIFVESTGAP